MHVEQAHLQHAQSYESMGKRIFKKKMGQQGIRLSKPLFRTRNVCIPDQTKCLVCLVLLKDSSKGWVNMDEL